MCSINSNGISYPGCLCYVCIWDAICLHLKIWSLTVPRATFLPSRAQIAPGLGARVFFHPQVSKDKLHQVTPRYIKFIIAMIWLCLCLTCADFRKGRMFKLCESYPRIIPQKIAIMNVSFGIVWDCIGLTSYNGPDKLIDQCWPDPMIPGYFHIPSRNGESSPCARSLIIIPKLAGYGWLAGWLAG